MASKFMRIMGIKGTVGSPGSIPWDLIEPFDARAKKNHDQTLERLNERGGIDPVEAYLIMNDLPLSSHLSVTPQQCVDWLNSRIESNKDSKEATAIAEWLESLSRHPKCPRVKRYWYEGVASDIRNGAYKLA